MMKCKNHPDREAAGKCAGCEEEFCRDCLSQYQGKEYCAPCLKGEVTVATARLKGNEAELARMKRSLIGCSAVLLIVVLTPMFLLIYPCFKLGDVGRCRANLGKIYKALVTYAKEHDGWFPPDNNDLRPLFTEGRRKDTKWFTCPGGERMSASVESMRPSMGSAETFPPGMSYFYQGGLGLPEEGESAKPLMWDRTSGNHRGQGINVLHTDGHIKFRKGRSGIKLHRMESDSQPPVRGPEEET